MKRLITLSLALVFVFAIATTMLMPKDAHALGGQLFGDPQGLGFDSEFLVDVVRVRVAKGWLESDAFSLAITILGSENNHGSAVITLNSSQVFSADRATADLDIGWNSDLNHRVQGEAYTVCVQILVNGKPVGEPMCNLPPWEFDFGTGPEL